MGNASENLLDAELSKIEEAQWGKPLPPEIRKRVFEIYEGQDGAESISREEELRRIQQIRAWLQMEGYIPKDKGTAARSFSPFRRFLKALHLA